eukprot:CAMPEP_0169081186 /NCGR_PEP_ID=MMETSP1015-20121227/10873_1 /TAXON_ID=342587 /ORGANISM="Karlodinium micrum, Strain CCMP2283" /LENGTH=242 /DNA_ID=CAMNT_0009140951 /DNA_START=89 /DNA_END=817 /DNA_ORIENTATION=-
MGNVGNIQGCNVALAQNGDGCSSLENARKVKECLDPCVAGRGIDPLTDQECANIALVQAAMRGDAEDVSRAIAIGASPNTIADITLRMGEPKKGRKGKAVHLTPLMRACELGHEDVVTQLLNARASAIMCDSHGWTSLCHALGAGEINIARIIAQHPGINMKRQKEICRKLQSEVVAKCQAERGQEAASLVQVELGPGGLLDTGNHAEPDILPQAGAQFESRCRIEESVKRVSSTLFPSCAT